MGRRRSFTPPPPEVGAPSSSAQYLPSRNRVYIYSRQLAVTDVPIEPVGSALFGDPSVAASCSGEAVVTKKTPPWQLPPVSLVRSPPASALFHLSMKVKPARISCNVYMAREMTKHSPTHLTN